MQRSAVNQCLSGLRRSADGALVLDRAVMTAVERTLATLPARDLAKTAVDLAGFVHIMKSERGGLAVAREVLALLDRATVRLDHAQAI